MARQRQRHEREQAEMKLRAAAAMRSGRGVYNVSPYGWVVGTAGALLAVLYALYAATRAPHPPSGEPNPAGEELIWVEP